MDARVVGETLVFEGWHFDRQTRLLYRQDTTGTLTPAPIGSRARDILMLLLEMAGSMVSKDAIMEAVWPGTAVEPNNLNVQIAALRRVLDEGRAGDSCIQTVPGRGYRFVLRVTRLEQGQPDLPSAPADLPKPAELPRHPRRHWSTAAWCAVVMAMLLGAAAWHSGWFAGAPPPPRLSIVVLPFENIGGDAADTYLAAGVTDELTTAIAHIGGAFVIAQATANTYRGKAVDIRQLGRDLGVRYVVRGSVQRAGSALRVNAELGSTETGAQLWSDTFDQSIDDLALGQEEIVVRMRSALNISLADVEVVRSLHERPTNPDAFDLVLRARAVEWLPRTKDTAVKALDLYEQALARDPDAILALTGAVNMSLSAHFLDAAPYDTAMDRAVRYLDRAQGLAPNAESVLVARSAVLDFQQEGIEYRRVRSELEAVAQKISDLYPNNPTGHFELGVVRRHQARDDEAATHFAAAMRLNPRNPFIRNFYWNLAYCYVWGGHDQEGLKWIDRTMSAEGGLPTNRLEYLATLRVVALARTGDLAAAKRFAQEINDRDPLETWRSHAPDDPESQQSRKLAQSFVDALRAAGTRDHIDADADFGVAPSDVLRQAFTKKTPPTAPGVTTVSTRQLARMLEDMRPLVIDTMWNTWLRSIPGAVGVDFNGNAHGSFTDEVQQRLERKLHTLTGGDMAKPIVAVGWNAARFDGYNLALRIHHAGYTNVYWYRGGREAWEVARLPETDVDVQDW